MKTASSMTASSEYAVCRAADSPSAAAQRARTQAPIGGKHAPANAANRWGTGVDQDRSTATTRPTMPEREAGDRRQQHPRLPPSVDQPGQDRPRDRAGHHVGGGHGAGQPVRPGAPGDQQDDGQRDHRDRQSGRRTRPPTRASRRASPGRLGTATACQESRECSADGRIDICPLPARPRRTTRCSWSRSVGRSDPKTCSRSSRTSRGGAASRPSGSPRSASTTTTSAAAARSTTSAGRSSSAVRADLAEHGIELPVYWGNRNWDPYLRDTLATMAADGVRRAAAFVTSAYSSYSGCRQYRENLFDAVDGLDRAPRLDKLRHYFNHPGFVAANTDATIASLETLSDGERAGARLVFVTHSIPTSMADGSGPDGGAYEAQHRSTAASGGRRRARRDRPVARVGPGLLQPVGLASHPVAGARRQRPPRSAARRPARSAVVVVPIGFVSDHMEVVYDLDTEAAATAARLGLTMRRAATAGVHPGVRGRRTRPPARASRGRARRAGTTRGRWERWARAGTCARPPAAPTRAPRARRCARHRAPVVTVGLVMPSPDRAAGARRGGRHEGRPAGRRGPPRGRRGVRHQEQPDRRGDRGRRRLGAAHPT